MDPIEKCPPGCKLRCSEATQRECQDKSCEVFVKWYTKKWREVCVELKKYDLSGVELSGKI